MLKAATEFELKNLKGIVYLIINKINYKRYIGQSVNTFRHRYKKSWWKNKSINKHFRRSIEKYGHENFEIRIILDNQTALSLDYWETFYIDYFQTLNMKYGYNFISGNLDRQPNIELRQHMSIKISMTKEEFIRRAIEIHGDKYDYSKVEILPFNFYVNIFCKKHNKYFLQLKNSHLCGKGCVNCAYEQKGKNKSMKKEEFIVLSKEKYQDEFEYSLENYKCGGSKIEILHKSCGTRFTSVASSHIHWKKKFACPQCWRKLKRQRNVKVVQIDKDKKIILNFFNSIVDAAKSTKISQGSIQQSCKKGYAASGYFWRYLVEIKKYIINQNSLSLDYLHNNKPHTEVNKSAKLKNEDIREIRRLYSTGRFSCTDIGKLFNITGSNIHCIITRQTWKHIL